MLSVKLLTWLTTFILIILSELGDKTQVAVLLMASNNPTKRWLILGASAIALTLCVFIEVTVGVILAKYIGPELINRATGVLFLFLGSFILATELGLIRKLGLKKASSESQDFSA